MMHKSVDEMLATARSRITRLTPQAAATAVRHGAVLVDIRPAWQRAETGEIPGSLIVERNHLEWRADPASSSRLPIAHAGLQWVVICAEGYTSSLAADSLTSMGVLACDVEGGFEAWAAAGLPTVTGEPTAHDEFVPPGKA